MEGGRRVSNKAPPPSPPKKRENLTVKSPPNGLLCLTWCDPAITCVLICTGVNEDKGLWVGVRGVLLHPACQCYILVSVVHIAVRPHILQQWLWPDRKLVLCKNNDDVTATDATTTAIAALLHGGCCCCYYYYYSIKAANTGLLTPSSLQVTTTTTTTAAAATTAATTSR